MRKKVEQARLYIFLAGVATLLLLIAWRSFDIAVRRHDWYAQTAQAQASGSNGVLLRGNLYISDAHGEGFLVATNRKFPALAIVAVKIVEARLSDTLDRVTAITGLDRTVLEKAMINGATGSRTLLRHLTDEQAAAIVQLNEPGVTITYETDRSYPAGPLASHLIGFLGYSEQGRQGQYGVEAYYDTTLSGQSSVGKAGNWDIIGQLKGLIGKVPLIDADTTDDRPQDVQLTIDKNIQAYVEDALAHVLDKYRAPSGTIIVQEPLTGKIMAMAGSPSFDPNHYSKYPVASFTNTAVQEPFEPGSSFKPFTMAAGLDLGKITPNTTFDDINDVVVDGYTIKNYNEGHFGRVTMTKILEKSINSGTMYVESLMTNDQFLNYVINQGFGQKTGIDLPGEASGNIGNLYTGRRINFLTSSFGQGITVTPLQLINAYSAIANGGKLMRPYVVSAVRDDQGREQLTKPEVVGTPFSAKTAASLRSMLTSVVDNGFDKARIPRYDVAGKTGTAQIADSVNGGYLEKEYNHSFVGFAPSTNPRFVILIKIEKPQGITFASDSLSPVFKDITLFLLNYLNIPPTR